MQHHLIGLCRMLNYRDKVTRIRLQFIWGTDNITLTTTVSHQTIQPPKTYFVCFNKCFVDRLIWYRIQLILFITGGGYFKDNLKLALYILLKSRLTANTLLLSWVTINKNLLATVILNQNIAEPLYTVGHKKRATLFVIITPMFRGGFLHFLHQWKQEKYSIGELQNLQLHHNCVSTLPEKS